MKITFLIRSLDTGGTEAQLALLASGLCRRGHEVSVISLYSGGAFDEILRKSGVSVYSLDKRSRWAIPGVIIRLSRIVRRLRPDVLYSFPSAPNILAVVIKPFCFGTRTVWGLRTAGLDYSGYDATTRLAFYLECRLSRFADRIIANSQAGRAYAEANGYPEAKLTVIPNGIDTERFHLDRQAGVRIRRNLKIGTDHILIGLVARLDPLKDHPTFLRAAALLSAKRPDARFVCVGGGDSAYLDQLKELAKVLGLEEKLIWAGLRGDLPAIYNAFDLATCTSIVEGFPNVVGEAMACGIPCVATDAGDCAEILEDGSLISEPGNPDMLFQRWDDILSKSPAELKEVGIRLRNRVVANYGIDQLITNTEAELWQKA